MSADRHLPSGLVTFLFTDIEGSTRLAQMLGNGYRPVLAEHRRLLRSALRRADGVELFTEGDSYFFVFTDPAAAVLACAEGQRALAAYAWPSEQAMPRVRMGLHTGFAQPHAGEYASAEVHRAARVANAAHGGQILLSEATATRTRQLPDETWLLDLGLHKLRGFDGHERLFQLVAPGLSRHFPRLRTSQAPAHNLPSAITPFVGRATERADLSDLVARQRLVTVVGSGGAGKTRLAVEVAGDLVGQFPDGVWLLDLATISDPGLVGFTLMNTLGLRPEPGKPVLDTLVEYAANRRMLLVLDTCEAQLAGVRAVIAQLLTAGRGVHVLATSREPLSVPGEVVWRIPPLGLEPGPGAERADAVALLIERTTAARGGRVPAESEIRSLGRVATRLDGLPLALELAAARLRVLSAGELADRLENELDGKAPDPLGAIDGTAMALGEPSGRHATLQATVEWSYRTLPPAAAALLRGLSVFAGPVDLQTVEWWVDGDPLDTLATLVDKSLLQVGRDTGRSEYRMLDPIRAFAARCLTAEGEERAVRDRHLRWALHRLERAQQGADGRPVTLSMYSLDPLAGELRAALRWCVTGGSARLGLRIASGLDQWWRERGLAREGRLWHFRLYSRLAETGEHVPDRELALVYYSHSMHACADGETSEEIRFAQRAEVAARRSGDAGTVARVLAGQPGPLVSLGKAAEAEQLCRDLLSWAGPREVTADALFAIYNLAELLWLRGAYSEAAELLATARPVEALRPAERGRRTVDLLLGMAALGRRDLVAAHDHLSIALRSRMSYGFHSRACVAVNAMAARCVLGGDHEMAATLFGAAAAAKARLCRGPGIFGAYWTAQQAVSRGALGDAAFDAAWARGSTMSLEDASSLALDIEAPRRVDHELTVLLDGVSQPESS
ncbi:MAG: adenylate/guanylate cyclase domain-containing protein [Hamadaea sp.]|nr:adenylate/guanylate cyclase domain-containing protein [Hamadaea sp.]NUR47132.1 adenylate/guanylate cyclase domain-containing protein [Hamadaea sp.]NUT04005.1 adenylate/guanylate cyclase domain-containing protein [Hamadaea sp.]